MRSYPAPKTNTEIWSGGQTSDMVGAGSISYGCGFGIASGCPGCDFLCADELLAVIRELDGL